MTQHYKWPSATNFALVGVFSNRQEMEDALMGLNKAGYMPDVVTVIEKELAPVREGPTEPGFNSAYARVTINVPDGTILDEVRAILEKHGAYGTRYYKVAAPLPAFRPRF